MIAFIFVVLAAPASSQAQSRTAKSVAPVDVTGYWVSVVDEDWRHRMMTARKGDYESVPLNPEGVRAANAWDLAKDNQSGLQCKAFGVGGIMRQPGRIHITWQDDNTLKMEFDAGSQTRLLRFGEPAPPAGEKDWQGYSVAQWEGPAIGQRGAGRGASAPRDPGGGGQGLRGGPAPAASIFQGGSLKVTTTHFREGYLRKNGVPYSENASITEYVHRLPQHPNGDNWLLVVTVIDDPKYLTQPFYTSTQFKLEPDGAKFKARPCSTAPPPAGAEK